MYNYQHQRLDTLSEEFKQFAHKLCKHLNSPLYERLSLKISEDPEVMSICDHAHQQPAQHLFFAAVQYLLFKNSAHPLATFYPSLSKTVRKDADPYPDFREFCLKHKDTIQALISTRLIQTNYVRRCASLLPAFMYAMREFSQNTISLVEIGASAGLNLLWDHYAYSYVSKLCGVVLHAGDMSQALVQINCDLYGKNLPDVSTVFPLITNRVGIDLNPINISDPDDLLWLRSLVWPEHRQQAALLNDAVAIARKVTYDLVRGNAVDVLLEVIKDISDATVLGLFNSYSFYQLTEEEQIYLEALIEDVLKERDGFWVSLEWHDSQSPSIRLRTYIGGKLEEQFLARCSVEGHWLEWLISESEKSKLDC